MMKQLFLAFFSVTLYSILPGQTKIALKVGPNFSTASVYQLNQKLETKYITGYGIGILFKVPFEGVLHFSPYVAYNRRGYQYIPHLNSVSLYKNIIHYIDIVPSLSIDVPVGKCAFVISAGPHVSVAVAGTEEKFAGPVSTKSKMKFSTSSDYGLFDLGFAGSMGYHFKKFFTEAGFQLGLANINNNEEMDKRSIQNRMISLQVGYYFK